MTPSNLSSRPRLLIIRFKHSDASYTNNNSMFIQEKDGKRITSLQIELKDVLYWSDVFLGWERCSFVCYLNWNRCCFWWLYCG